IRLYHFLSFNVTLWTDYFWSIFPVTGIMTHPMYHLQYASTDSERVYCAELQPGIPPHGPSMIADLIPPVHEHEFLYQAVIEREFGVDNEHIRARVHIGFCQFHSVFIARVEGTPRFRHCECAKPLSYSGLQYFLEQYFMFIKEMRRVEGGNSMYCDFSTTPLIQHMAVIFTEDSFESLPISHADRRFRQRVQRSNRQRHRDSRRRDIEAEHLYCRERLPPVLYQTGVENRMFPHPTNPVQVNFNVQYH
ncbi:MAG: hypothetical protein CUN57_00485, partial [Phototrophicales bacterium]